MKRLKSERGSAAALIAVLMVALLVISALGVDYGRGVALRSRLQKVADAAALAGAMKLSAGAAEAYNSAIDFCARNGVQASDARVSFPDSPATRIYVQISHSMNYIFGGVLEHSSGTVTVGAEAQSGIVGALSGLVPVGVEKRSFSYGVTYRLKRGTGSCSQEAPFCSNFGPLSLGGTGADNYLDKLEHGYSGVIKAGDWIETEPGNIVGPTGTGLRYRINQAPDETYQTFAPGSPRLVYVPILDSLLVNGRTDVLVTGFAAFFLEDTGSQGEILGRFIRYHVPGPVDPNAGDNGLASVMLLK